MDVQNKQTVILDLRKNSIAGMPSYIQEDSNVIEFTIMDNGATADLANVGNIVVNYKRPDKAVISRLLTAEGNKVTYTIGSEEMKVPGYGELEIQFYSDDNLKRISTKRFKTYISQQIGSGDILEGDSNLTLLQELFVDVETTKQSMVNAEALRESNETTRQSQETARQTNTATAIDNVNAARDTALTNWLAPVANFSAIATTYTAPVLGDTVQVLDTGYVYRFNGTEWIYTQGYSATALAGVTSQLAQKANQSDISTYVNIKKFGAKGDGVTDDSAAFKTAFTSGVDGLYIPPGTYIINITAGTSHTNRYFVEPANVTKVFGVKGKSIIKLGSGNCDERVYKGFHSLFNYHADDLDIVWDGITFDYNNANNPVYQTTGQYVGVENNIGQMAISATGRTFGITNCTFKDCSGTNVLYFTPRVGNTGNAIVTISHNKFQNMGIATNYVDGSNNTLSARHDCSTISLHNITETNYTLTTKVHDNEFIAADTNAYNTCESTGDIQHFYNNTVRGYVQGTLIEPSHKDVVARVYNNNFLNVMHGVSIWTSYVETTDAVDTTNSYKLLEIKNNKILIDPIAFRSKVTYFENTIGADTYVLHYYHGIRFSGQIKRNVDTIAIENNDIEFTYVNGATAGNLNNNSGSSAYGSYHSGEAIGFWQMFDGTTNSSFTSAPYLTSLKIKGNTFRNSYRSPILMQTFPRIDYIDISGNQFYNCLIDITFFSNKELCKISYAGNGVNSPYKSNAVMLSYMKSLIFNDNIVIDTQVDNILDINIDNTSFSVANSLLSFKNNTVMLTPTQYMYILNGVAGSIANKITDTASHN